MTPAELGAATLVVIVGALVQGVIGFGLGLVAAPILLLINPAFIPGPLIASSLVLTLLLARRDWHGVIVRDLGWALSGRFLGTLIAMAVLTVLSQHLLDLLFGGLVLTAVLLTASGLHPGITPRVLLVVGTMSGFMGTTASIGGPPIALLYQREPGPRLRGTLSAFFVVGVVLSLSGLAIIGRYGVVELRLSLALIPGVLTGYLLSRRVATVLDGGPLRPAVLAVSFLAALAVILRGF